ncbi:unnamed protein product [Rhizopus stolonifer]
MIPIEVEAPTVEERVQLARDALNDLEIVKKCRTDPDLVEHKAYNHFSESQKKHSLTYSTLRGPDMIIIPPVMFYNKSYTEITIIVHLGKNICGHDGIIHGGLSATLLDEALAAVVRKRRREREREREITLAFTKQTICLGSSCFSQ